ncbi:MAG: hypothetical protein KC457_00920 [Myxococcales bacterium]|nr:hypothetical protein [Myxococcales bacterium]
MTTEPQSPKPSPTSAAFSPEIRADAEAAFSAYCASAQGLTHDGLEVPSWSAMAQKPQSGHWCEAAKRLAPRGVHSPATAERLLVLLAAFVGASPAELVSAASWRKLVGLADRERSGKMPTAEARAFAVDVVAGACKRLGQLE